VDLAVALLWTLPWIGPWVAFFARVRLPRPLPGAGGTTGTGARSVSVIIPARNEAHNIERLLRSLAATRHPDFEVLVVDDRSGDDTAVRARAAAPGHARRLVVLDGEPLPEGWLGKPWACHQGARRARGELLLFTDADTVHAPDLLVRAAAALDEDAADAVTVVGRQLVESFWERLVQPQIFAAMLARYRDSRRPLPPHRWRDAIANGQYILLPRATYDAIGGHEALRCEVVEDLKMAQRLVRAEHVLSVRRAEDGLATRMYRSLGELVAGWSKNLVLGGRATLPPGVRRTLMPPVALLVGLVMWVLPPLVLAAALAGAGGSGTLVWSALVTSAAVVFWGVVYARFGVSPAYALLYPMGALVGAWILVRAWVRGTRVAWKGREYRVAESDAGV
jgi:chlorobactene glucosyltransferase